MESELDLNKIVAMFINKNIEAFYQTGKDALKGAATNIRPHLEKMYGDYLLCMTERYTKTKSFFFRNPTPLYDFYVPMDVIGLRTYHDTDGRQKTERDYSRKASILSISSETHFAIINGIGGMGKTMLMRHLIIDTIIQTEKVPIYLELKVLNDSSQTVLEFIENTLHSNGFRFGKEFINKTIEKGGFAFLFDGFDEVKTTLRRSVSNQIIQLAKGYGSNLFIVASRPDNIFTGWEFFVTFQIKPLTLIQAEYLIEKLPFDSDFKTRFIHDLNTNLFQKHKSFLSNPLLLSIMALTYDENADVPTKLSLFYSQAYEALFHRHDALKGDLQRERSCTLDIQDFAKAFGAFSLATYDDRKTQFTREETLTYLQRIKSVINIEFDTSAFLRDVLQAVCLLVEDGLMITYTHRSFQEFFVAKFICTLKPDTQYKLVNKYIPYRFNDSVMDLLYEMKPEMVERNCFLRILEELERFLGAENDESISSDRYLLYLKQEFKGLHFENEEYEGYSLNSTSRFQNYLEYAFSKCGHLINRNYNSHLLNEDRWRIYLDSSGNREIDIASLNSHSRIFHTLSIDGGVLSKRYLEEALRLKSALVNKHNKSDASLDELLGI